MADAVLLDPEMRASLIQRRKDLGFTQRALAAQLGIQQSQLCDLETGRVANPRLSSVRHWCAALGLRVDLNIYDPQEEK